MNTTITLVDQSDKIILPIATKLLEKYGTEVNIQVITECDFFEQYFDKPRRIDLLIINENLYNSEISKHSFKKILILTEKEEEDDVYINKFLNIGLILRKICMYIDLIVNNSEKNTNKVTQIIACYSPCGGIGKTTIALGLSEYFARIYKKTLYINAENINLFNHYIGDSKTIDILDYQEMVMAEDLLSAVKTRIQKKDSFDYFPPFKKSLISYGTDISFYIEILHKLRDENKYDYIFVDLNSDFSIHNTQIIDMADKVLVILDQSGKSRNAAEKLKENMSISDDKYVIVCNNYYQESTKIDPNITTINIDVYIRHIYGIEEMDLKTVSFNEDIRKAGFLLY